jgi:hypothetical protein
MTDDDGEAEDPDGERSDREDGFVNTRPLGRMLDRRSDLRRRERRRAFTDNIEYVMDRDKAVSKPGLRFRRSLHIGLHAKPRISERYCMNGSNNGS